MLQYVYMSLTTGIGKESYVQHIWRGLKSKGAAHVWIALGFVYRISEVQTASYKALCTRKVLRQDKSKFYRGFPVSRPILTSYTKPTHHTRSSCSPPLLPLCMDTLHHGLCDMFHRHCGHCHWYTRT